MAIPPSPDWWVVPSLWIKSGATPKAKLASTGTGFVERHQDGIGSLKTMPGESCKKGQK